MEPSEAIKKRRAYHRAYHAANRKRLNELSRKSYHRNKLKKRELINKQSRQKRSENIEASRKKESAWREANRDKIRAYHRKYYADNREKALAYAKEWGDKNRLKIRASQNARLAKTRKQRWANDPNFRIGSNIRRRIHNALVRSGVIKSFHAMDVLGCSVPEFRKHIESQFTPENCFTWNNYGETWEIDHIVPVARFDLTDAEQLKKCFHYTNCQPLHCSVNRSKGDSLDHRFMPTVRMVEKPIMRAPVNVRFTHSLVDEAGL